MIFFEIKKKDNRRGEGSRKNRSGFKKTFQQNMKHFTF